MGSLYLQEKIDKLQDIAGTLLHSGNNRGDIYADDFARMNKEVHELINDLYPLRGATIEQEVALCSAILYGYSVSIYANPDDDTKKRNVLARIRIILKKMSPSHTREQLLTMYNDAILTII